MKIKFPTDVQRLILCLALVTVVAGCQWGGEKKWKFADAFDLEKGMPWHDDDEVPRGTPTRLSATWTDAVLHAPGRTPERGFGGKVMFFDGAGSSPIAVEGDLIVYAFDETDRKSYDNQPNKRYVFPQPELDKLMKVTEIGPAYNVWLPWDVVGGDQTKVSLICRFQPREGPFFASDQASLTLPGRLANLAAQDPASASQSRGGVVPAVQQNSAAGWGISQRAEQVSYESSTPASGWKDASAAGVPSTPATVAAPATSPWGEGAGANRPGMRTTTITLPTKQR